MTGCCPKHWSFSWRPEFPPPTAGPGSHQNSDEDSQAERDVERHARLRQGGETRSRCRRRCQMSQIPCATSVRATTTRPAVGAGHPRARSRRTRGSRPTPSTRSGPPRWCATDPAPASLSARRSRARARAGRHAPRPGWTRPSPRSPRPTTRAPPATRGSRAACRAARRATGAARRQLGAQCALLGPLGRVVRVGNIDVEIPAGAGGRPVRVDHLVRGDAVDERQERLALEPVAGQARQHRETHLLRDVVHRRRPGRRSESGTAVAHHVRPHHCQQPPHRLTVPGRRGPDQLVRAQPDDQQRGTVGGREVRRGRATGSQPRHRLDDQRERAHPTDQHRHGAGSGPRRRDGWRRSVMDRPWRPPRSVRIRRIPEIRSGRPASVSGFDRPGRSTAVIRPVSEPPLERGCRPAEAPQPPAVRRSWPCAGPGARPIGRPRYRPLSGANPNCR